MATFRELVTKFTFQTDEKGLDAVEHKLDAIKHRLEFLGAVEIAKGIYELTERFAHFAEEIHVAATSAGLTVEAFQKLAFSAQQSGVSQEEMGTAMTRLSRSLYAARMGSEEANKAFAQAGFSPDQVRSFKTGEDAMMALADRMKGMSDPIQKQALALQLMGRGSVHMVGYLSQGSGAIRGMGKEAEALGAVLNEKQVAALVNAEHAFLKLWAAIKGIAASIAAVFAPEVQYIIDCILGWTKANHGLVSVDVTSWIRSFLYGLGFIIGVIEGVIHKIVEFANSHKTLWRIIETLGILGASLLVASLGFSKLISIGQSLLSMWSGASAILTSPFALMAMAIFGVIVAVHDLWQAAHGRPTWVGSFIEWLGIAHEVESVFFAIFQLLDDLFHFRIGSIFKDIKNDLVDLVSYVMGVLNSFGLGKILGGTVNVVKNVGESIAPSPADPNASRMGAFWKNLPRPMFPKSVDNAVAPNPLLSNITSVPMEPLASQDPMLNPMLNDITRPPASLAAQVSPANNQYSVNAPITVNVPAGTDHEIIGQKVQAGVREHLDRVYRETNRSLRPAQAY